MIQVILFICVEAFLLYMAFIRNTNVYNFQTKVCDAVYNNLINWLSNIEDDIELQKKEYEYLFKQHMAKHIIDKHSYLKMLLVLKPLRLENWYSDEEIEFINEGR